MMGYLDSMDGYKLYDLERQQMTKGYHVRFQETEFMVQPRTYDPSFITDDSDDESEVPTKASGSPVPAAAPSGPVLDTPRGQVEDVSMRWARRPSLHLSESITPRPTTSNTPTGSRSSFRSPSPRSTESTRSQSAASRSESVEPSRYFRDPAQGTSLARGPATVDAPPTMAHPQRSTRPPRRDPNEGYEFGHTSTTTSVTMDGAEYAMVAVPSMHDVPRNHAEAMASNEAAHWRLAEKLEMEALRRQTTFVKVSRGLVPQGATMLRTMFFYQKKFDKDGKLIRYKARLVVQGNFQVTGVDYDATFSPVVRMATVRVIMALILVYDLVAVQVDADNAYVQAPMDKGRDIYIYPIQGHSDGSDDPLLLLRALYGLKQAALAWFKHCRAILLEIGFVSSDYDLASTHELWGEDFNWCRPMWLTSSLQPLTTTK